MHILYHGHSCIQATEGEHSVIIDPYLTGSPVAVGKADEVRVQYVLLTHGHFDHITDAAFIAKQNCAPIIANQELAGYFERQGLPTEGMDAGGELRLPFGRVYLTQANHSSSIAADDGTVHYGGLAAGFVLMMGDTVIYHAGDTGLFGDMQWIGKRFDIDIAFLPIGGRFTMGPDDALAAAELIGARCVIPIHYNTFPPIRQDGPAFISSLTKKGMYGKLLAPGEKLQVKHGETHTS